MALLNLAITYLRRLSRLRLLPQELQARISELESERSRQQQELAQLAAQLDVQKQKVCSLEETSSLELDAARRQIGELKADVQREQEKLDLHVRTLVSELQEERALRIGISRELSTFRINSLSSLITEEPARANGKRSRTTGKTDYLILDKIRGNSRRPIGIFLHIHKTAGATLSEFLRRNVPVERRVELYTDPKPSLETIGGWIKERGEDLDMIFGHFPYADRIESFVDRPVVMYTILRDPLDRTISLYYYLRQIAAVNPVGRSIVERELSLLDVIKNPFDIGGRFFDNGLVRMLATEMADASTPCNRKMLEEAKNNLKSKFAIIGVQENLDDFMQKLCYAFCFKFEQLPKYNVTEKRESLADIPPSVKKSFEETNALDRELYEFARELASARAKIPVNR